jgi:hypothetical protein
VHPGGGESSSAEKKIQSEPFFLMKNGERLTWELGRDERELKKIRKKEENEERREIVRFLKKRKKKLRSQIDPAFKKK